MKKRILSILLALCMCLTFVPVTVLAEDLQQDNGISVQSITPDEGTYYTYVFTVDGKEIDRQIVKNGDTLLEPKVPAQDGKVFTGWDQTVPFGVIAGLAGDNQTITVAAQFAEGYPVYFKDNSGRIIATKTGKTGDIITFEDVNFPVGADEAITGWYTGEGFTTKVESVTIATSSVTLYGKVEKGYWVTFESNGGSYVAPAFYAKDTAATAPTAPTKLGYTFDGWYTDEGLTAAANFGSITGSVTLYAKWTASQQTKYTVIHFWENADDDEYSFQESETKTGATGDKTNATAKSYPGFTAQTITQQDIKGDGSTIVSVKYKRNVYEVKFYNRSGQTEDTSKRITAKYGANIADKWPGGGWYVSTSGNTAQSNIDTMPLNGKNFYGQQSGNKTFTAYYYTEVLPGQTGTVTKNGRSYDLDHTDVIKASGSLTVTDEERYPITGFTCNTADSTRNGSSYNGSKFYYTRNEYKLVFVNNGSTDKTVTKKFEQSIADASYTPTAPAGMTDYVFAGWYDNELGEGTAYVFDGKTMPAQNITLYAKWVAPTYTVTVHDVNGTVLKTFTEVAKNSTISSDEMPALSLAEGETFLGWVQEDGTPFNFSTKINRDYDLYAKVGNSSRYTVTYHRNTTPDATVTDSEMIYAKDVLATVNDNTFTNSGKIFLSWNTRADGKGATYYPNGTIKVTGNMDLYAQWGDVASTVTVTYHSNFGTDVAQSVAAVANNSKITVEAYNALNLPERTGYSFVGWNTKADGTGRTFAAGASARVDVTEPNDLYAVWKINQYSYTVEYYIDNVKDDSMTETGKADFGTVIDSYKDKCPTGYAFDKDENLPLTIGVTESENVIKVFYKKNVFDLTIHYVYAEGGTAADDYAASVTFGDPYSVDSPVIDGYTADKPVVSGNMPANNVEVTVIYTKRSDLSYTVNYYWNDKTTLLDSKTVNGQTFNASVTESPIAIDGYTPVSDDSKTITITTGANVINFYYYKNVELTANSGTATYDGNEHSVSGFTGAPAGADFSVITVDAKGTEAGTYPANFAEGTVGTVDATKKYIVTAANDGTLVITPVEEVIVTITGTKATSKYDGSEKSASGFTAAFSNPLYTASDYTFSGSAIVKATDVNPDGAYAMGLTADQFTNTNKNFAKVTFVVNDGSLTITPRELTITSASDEKVYDGQPLVKHEVSVTGDGFVDGEGATYAYTGSQTTIGESPNSFTYALNENTKAQNYTIITTPGTLKVTPVTGKVTVTITERSGSAKYDGTEHTVTGYDVAISNPLYTTGDFTFTGDATIKGTDADTYNMELKPSDFTNTNKNFSNVEFVIVDGTLVIEKRSVKLTSASDEKVYDGTALTNDTVTVTGDGFAEGEGASYNVTGTITNVGKADNTFTYTLNAGTKAGNYEITKEVGELEVTPVTDKVTVTITGHKDSFKYDGDAHTVTGYDVAIDNELYTEADFTFSGSSTVSGTNVADSAPMGLKAGDFTNTNDNFTNVEFEVTDGSLTITKRDVTLTSGDGEKVYDGTPLTNGTVSVTDDGFADGEGASFDVTGTITDVGKVDNAFTYTLNEGTNADNYNITKVEGKLEVTPVTEEVIVTITGHNDSVKYDGATHIVDGYDVAINNVLYTEADFTFSGNAHVEGVNAKTSYEMGLKAGDFTNNSKNFTNVTFLVTDGYLTITKRDVTLTSGSDSKAYDGTPLTKDEVIVSGDGFAEGEGASYNVTGTITNVGSVKNTFTYTLNEGTLADNYNIAPIPGDLTITADENEVVVTIVGNTDTQMYDGKAHTVTGYEVTNISNSLYTEGDFTFNGNAEITGTDAKPSYMMGLKAGDFTNTNDNFAKVTFVVTDGSLTITKRTVAMTSGSASRVYNGEPLTNGTVTVSGDGFAEGEGASYNVTGTITNVGKVDNEFTYTLNAGTKAGNYEITTTPGELEVTPVTDEVIVTITGKEGSFKYDGSEKTVSGYTVSIDNKLYTEQDFTFSGNAEVKGTDVADSALMGLKAGDFTNTNDNFTNVKFEVTDGSLTITKRSVKLTSASDEKVYDGTPLTNSKITVSGDGFVRGEGADYDVTGTITNVGKVDNAFTYTLKSNTKDGNYEITTELGTLEVTPVTDEVIVTIVGNKDSFMYDGDAHTVTGYTVTGISSKLYTTADFKFTGTDEVTGTDAKTFYMMGLSAGDFENISKNFTNVKFEVTDGSLTITKRSVKLTSATDSKVYDGTPLTNSNVTVSGDGFVKDEGAIYDVTGSITNFGSVDNEFTYTLNEGTLADNYEISTEFGTLTIEAVKDEVVVVIVGNTKSEIYDATEKTVSGYQVVSISNDLYTEKDFVLKEGATDTVTQINAGTYPMGLDFENISQNFANVTFDVTDGSLEIKQRDVTFTGESATKTYNGKVQQITGITVEGLVEGHSYSGLTYLAEGKKPGKYEGSFSGRLIITDANGIDVTDNYNVTTVTGVLTIKQRHYPTPTPDDEITSVKTADNSQMALWMSMMLASAAGIVFFGKKRKEEQ